MNHNGTAVTETGAPNFIAAPAKTIADVAKHLKDEAVFAMGLEGKEFPDLKESAGKAVEAGTKLIRTYPIQALLVGLGIGLVAGYAARGSRGA